MSLPAVSTNIRARALERTAVERKGCVSVLVPIYNEVEHVDELLERIQASPVDKEIVIIDDGSTDGTRDKLMQLRPSADITIVFHQQNCGKGAAIRTGLRYARGEYVLIQDSDLEYDPQDYAALVEPLQNGQANVVYGVRDDHPGRGLRFFLGARLMTLLANLLYGCGIHDEATCYKGFRRSLLNQLKLECRRFEFCPEVTAKLSRLGGEMGRSPQPLTSGDSRRRKEDPPLRRLAGDLDANPLPVQQEAQLLHPRRHNGDGAVPSGIFPRPGGISPRNIRFENFHFVLAGTLTMGTLLQF